MRRSIMFAVGVLALVAALMAAAARSEVHATSAESIDVLLAFDTTGSMGPSIAAAQRDAETIVSAVGGFAVNTRFAVASFRDRFYPGGQYALLTPMTPTKASVTAAINKLAAMGSPAADDTDAEAYNLLFNKSYTDANIGWRTGARKIVVVIGDAEPHSAGAESIAGCADTTRDGNDLSTRHELAGMRAAKRTLVMIRQAQKASTSLACYSSLASLAYEGGAARDGGSKDIGAPLLALLKQAYAPFVITSQLASAAAGKTNGLTVRITNPNAFPLEVSDLSIALPAGVAFVPGSVSGNLPKPVAVSGRLSWTLKAPVGPFKAVAAHLVLRDAKAGSATVTGNLTVSSPDGTTVTSKAKANVRIIRSPRRVTAKLDGARGQASIKGVLVAPISLGSGARGTGTVVLAAGSGTSVTLRTAGAAAATVGAPSNVAIRVTVARSSGPAACHAGTHGVLKLTDSDALTRAGKTRDRLTLVLPASCGGPKSFADARLGDRLELKLGFR